MATIVDRHGGDHRVGHPGDRHDDHHDGRRGWRKISEKVISNYPTVCRL